MKKALVFLSVLTTSLLANAQDDYLNYDTIVNRLAPQTTSTLSYSDPFADVMFHAGIGSIISVADLSLGDINPNNESTNGTLTGMEVNLGIDLFSRNWLSELSYRTLTEQELSDKNIVLHEFDIKVIYQNRLTSFMKIRGGGGLAARYLNYTDNGSTLKFTTPSSIFLVGLDAMINKNFSVGLEANYRTALINETIDQSAFSAGLRIDSHF